MSSDYRSFHTYIATEPETIWRAITRGEETRKFFDFTMGFMSVESAWAVGSSVLYRTADGEVQIEGKLLTTKRPRQLVMSFNLLYDPDLEASEPSELAWQIDQMGEVCKVTVTHEGSEATGHDVAICMPCILANLKVLLETGRPRLLKEIVFDCREPARLGTFWQEVMHYRMQGPTPTAEDDFVAIVDPTGDGPELGFQRVMDAKVTKNRVHLDLLVDNREAEVSRLMALGAMEVQTFRDGAWTVMTDPEGNEFCLVTG